MISFLEKLIARTWNRLATPSRPSVSGGLDLGSIVVDGRITDRRARIPHGKRAEHLALLGKSGHGKSSLIKHLCSQDVTEQRGWLAFDFHNDLTPFLLSFIAQEERVKRVDYSTRLIIVSPGDPTHSVGLNLLENVQDDQRFVQIAEFAEILKQRWRLEGFGARTEELLRNSLHVLMDNHQTLCELPVLLTHAAFRATCLRQVSNPEIAEYFRSRFDRASEAMQTVLRDAILNKVSTFTADPRFRHILGQRRSTFSLLDAIDQGYWIIFDLNKGRLGEQSLTLGSLLLTKLKNALFARRRRTLFTLYCDEIQNLVSFDSGLDTLLSESRKFAASIVSANQFSQQYPPQMQAAILAVGTHIFFQLSAVDGDKVSGALDGGKKLAEVLKNLPKRHLVVKSGHQPWHEVVVPEVTQPQINFADLYNRCRARWARRRTDIEQEIRSRHQDARRGADEVLNDWN